MDETPNHHHQQSLHFEQPQQQQGAGSIAGGSNQQQHQQHHPQQQAPHPHGREDCWSEGATFTLIQAWGDRYLHLNRGNLKQKHWRDVAEAVNLRRNSNGIKPKTDVQCKNRLDTLKKKYKLEKARLAAAAVASSSQQQQLNGNGASAAAATSKWVFFSKLDELIGPSKKGKSKQGGDAHNNAVSFLKQKKQVQISQDLHNNNNNTSSDEDDDEDDGDSSEMVMTDSSPFIGNPNGGGVFLLDPAAAAAAANNNNSNMKKKKKKKRKYEDEGGPFKDLARAIIKFGEVYERIETAKQQALVELEKQRMEFTRDMELQRMQLFVQTQVELAKMKQAKHGNTEHYL